MTALAPDEVEYAITVKYWIAESDQRSVSEIQSRIAAAVADFQTWQRKLGRDINPTELIARLREAGAKAGNADSPRRHRDRHHGAAEMHGGHRHLWRAGG